MPNTAREEVVTRRTSAPIQPGAKVPEHDEHPLLNVERCCNGGDSCLTLNGLPETKLSAISREITVQAQKKGWQSTVTLYKGDATFIAPGQTLQDMCKVVRSAVSSLRDFKLLDPNTKVLANLH